MINLYHAAVPDEPLQLVPAPDLAGLSDLPGWWWLDVVGWQDGDLAAIGAALDFQSLDLDDVFEPSTLPNFDEREHYLFVVAHTPSVDSERLRTVDVNSFLGRNYLVTIRREESPGMEEFAGVVTLEPVPGPDTLLAALLDVFARRTEPLVAALDREIDELEDLAIAGNPEVISRTQALRRDAIRLRQLLVPQRDVVRALSRDASGLVGDRARRRLDSTYDDYFRVADSLEVARALLMSVLDTYRGTVAERMNEVMKVLTVFSAIVLPLGLMAGIYGMNFANMPELDWRYGYFALLGVMAAVGVSLWLYFAKRGFIGGPKLPRVDRVVGRGLAAFVHLTVAPARTAINLLTASGAVHDGENIDGTVPETGP